MRRHMHIVISITLILVLIVLLFAVAKPLRRIDGSVKLVEGIKNGDIVSIREILQKQPPAVNSPATYVPKGLYVLLTDHRVPYPLIEACYTDNIEIVKLLVEAGANVNCYNGTTPLSAVYRNKKENWYEISQYLIENGASLDYITSNSGEASAVFYDIVQMRSRKGSPNDEEEVTAAFRFALDCCNHSKINWMRVLQHSTTNDRVEIVKLLLDEGYCDVNNTSLGMTALMFAARDSTPEMVQLLLDYGADKSIKSTDGKTAYDYAVQSNSEDVMAILEN